MNFIAIRRGIFAGFFATIVLSVLMMMKQAMGIMPALDPIGMIASMAGVNARALGWIGHFLIGTVFWGVGFALVSSFVPGPYWLRGVLFALGAWLLMMVVMMPMTGVGVFGLKLGMMVPGMTLGLHIVFGAVLGGIYGLLGGNEQT
jgi:hypothetical protein